MAASDENRRAAVGKRLEDLAQLGTLLHVETRGRIVEDEQPRTLREGARQERPPRLAIRERNHQRLAQLAQVQQTHQEFLACVVGLLRFRTPCADFKRIDLVNGFVRQEIVDRLSPVLVVTCRRPAARALSLARMLGEAEQRGNLLQVVPTDDTRTPGAACCRVRAGHRPDFARGDVEFFGDFHGGLLYHACQSAAAIEVTALRAVAKASVRL